MAASAARHTVANLAPFLDPVVAENAELLVSELVTNSLRHAGLPPQACIEFTLRATSEVVMVEVADAGRGFEDELPARPRVEPGTPEASGWGLFLVDQISDRWGAVQVEGETRVWFELRPGTRPAGLVDNGASLSSGDS
jgi:anti-sigma regulatory factor (Ser/Thr protein kinase)